MKSVYDNQPENLSPSKLIVDEKLIRREKDIICELYNDYICGYYKAQED